MTDYGQDIKLGVFVTPTAQPIEHSIQMLQLADTLGLDLGTLQDHPYQPSFGDTWTLLSVIGGLTSQIHLSANVFNLPLRPPFMLAKSAATLDLVTNGRVEMGIGAGLFWDGIEAAGGPRRTPGESIEALEEAIELMRAFWAGGTLRHEGQYYRAKGSHAGPQPAHEIPIWVGALKPRILRMVGRVADGWAPSLGYAQPDAIEEMTRILDEAALKAGRNPADITRMYNINGRFGTGSGLLQGTPENWAEQLAELTQRNGTSTFVLATDDPIELQTFAEEVGPRLKELVEAERTAAASVPVDQAHASDRTAEQITITGSGDESPDATAGQDAADAAPWPLTVQPVEDDGSRLTGELAWDESTRPTFVEPAGVDYPIEPAASHFMDVHNHLRAELDRVRDVLDQVRRGATSVGSARSEINAMTLRQNNWTLGAYCENYCSTVTGHHTMEDRGVFPHLRRAEPGLAPVLDRLEDEHHVIHDVLTDFDRALVELVRAEVTSTEGITAALSGVQRQLDLLTDTLLSHFSYEERELLPAMARVGLQ